MRRSASIGLLSLGAAAAFCAPAGAAQVVGSTLNDPPDAGTLVPGFTFAQTAPPTGAALPIAAPASGALVSVRISHGVVPPAPAAPAVVGLRILSGTPPNLTSRLDARLPNLGYRADEPAGVTSVVPGDASGAHGVPINVGERVGFATLVGNVGLSRPTPGAARGATAGTGAGPGVYADAPNRELLIQYTIEPDADADGWGDETQDRCPDDPTSNCPGRVVSTPVFQPGPTVAGPTITKTIACRTGTKPAGDHCAKIKCKKGRKLKGNKCVKRRAHRSRKR